MNNLGKSEMLDLTFHTAEIFVFFLLTYLLGVSAGWILCKRKYFKNLNSKKKKVAKEKIEKEEEIEDILAQDFDEKTGDDLDKILGITDEIKEVLKQNKIFSYEDLEKLNTKKLDHILPDIYKKDSFYRTWPNQAKFALENKWQDLHHYQAILVRNNNKKTQKSQKIEVVKKEENVEK